MVGVSPVMRRGAGGDEHPENLEAIVLKNSRNDKKISPSGTTPSRGRPSLSAQKWQPKVHRVIGSCVLMSQ